MNKSLIEDDKYLHKFEYYDRDNEISLNGRTKLITIELSKLENILKKDIKDLNHKENWAIFFKYAIAKRKRKLINKIIKKEVSIRMAAETLLNISQDEKMRYIIMQEEKRAQDYVSDMKGRYKKGLKEGMEKGIEKGIEKGMEKGMEKGLREGKIEVAKKMLKRNCRTEDVVGDTGLSIEEVNELRKQINQ